MAELEAVRAEAERSSKEASVFHRELKAVSHHRNVLRDSVEELEKQLRARAEDLADAQHQAQQFLAGDDASIVSGGGRNHRDRDRNADEEDVLRKQLARFRARTLELETLISIYRRAVLALYPDGTSYGAAQYEQQQALAHAPTGQQQQQQEGFAAEWIETEMALVKRSYDEEIRLLDREVGELRAKLQQSGSYLGELRKRFEEMMKSMYK